MTPPTRHRLSSEGSFFFFFFPHIYFKLVHSYNVKQLTCIIFCSSGLQNIIYKLHNWKCSTSTIFTLVYRFLSFFIYKLFMSSCTLFLVLVTVYYHRIAVLCFSYHVIYSMHFICIHLSISFCISCLHKP